MSRQSLYGVFVVAAGVGLGAVILNRSTPSSPADSTALVVDVLTAADVTLGFGLLVVAVGALLTLTQVL